MFPVPFANPEKLMEALQSLEPLMAILEMFPEMKVIRDLKLTTTDDKGNTFETE